jgi:hypothetical protein
VDTSAAATPATAPATTKSDHASKATVGTWPVELGQLQTPHDAIGFAEFRIDLQRKARGTEGRRTRLEWRHAPEERSADLLRLCDAHVGGRVGRIERDGALELDERARDIGLGRISRSEPVLAAKVSIVRSRTDPTSAPQSAALIAGERGPDFPSDRQRGTALQVQDVAQILLVRPCPEVSLAACIDELHDQPDAIPGVAWLALAAD